MIGQIYHVGLTVSDLDRSVAFYRDVLGLQYQGELLMEGKETEAMFRRENCKARVAYLNGSDQLHMPPVELIQFVGDEIHRKPMDLFATSISELCFYLIRLFLTSGIIIFQYLFVYSIITSSSAFNRGLVKTTRIHYITNGLVCQ